MDGSGGRHGHWPTADGPSDPGRDDRGGNPAGCTELGLGYEHGDRDLKKDLARAVSLYEHACRGGDPVACEKLRGLSKR